MNDVTRILTAIEQGDGQAAEHLLPLVYDELRKLAAARMAAEKPGHTLNATALVHEAYLRLVGDQHFDDRGHFFAAAAEAMRRILVNHARDRKRLKRAGGRVRLELLDQIGSLAEDPDLVLSLDELLTRLGEEDAAPHRWRNSTCSEDFRSRRRARHWGSPGRSPTGTGSMRGPGSAMLWKNNSKSARHFSPGWGIESMPRRMGQRVMPVPEVNHDRRCRTSEIPFPGRVGPRRSGGACRLPGARVRR